MSSDAVICNMMASFLIKINSDFVEAYFMVLWSRHAVATLHQFLWQFPVQSIKSPFSTTISKTKNGGEQPYKGICLEKTL